MIKSAKEAKDIFDKNKFFRPMESPFSEAKGYLDALNGPEVQDLVKALELSRREIEQLLVRGDARFDSYSIPEIDKALSNFREATKEKLV